VTKRKHKQPADDDLETWIRLGEGVPPENDEPDGLSEGERIVRAGNQWVAEQLRPSTPLRKSVLAFNPFRRE
jgi:hypothetical protein